MRHDLLFIQKNIVYGVKFFSVCLKVHCLGFNFEDALEEWREYMTFFTKSIKPQVLKYFLLEFIYFVPKLIFLLFNSCGKVLYTVCLLYLDYVYIKINKKKKP